jgi:hypothetical protein
MAVTEADIEKIKPLTFLQALGILFIGLKLAGEIDWHWGLVLIPIWMLVGEWFLVILIKAVIKTVRESK